MEKEKLSPLSIILILTIVVIVLSTVAMSIDSRVNAASYSLSVGQDRFIIASVYYVHYTWQDTRRLEIFVMQRSPLCDFTELDRASDPALYDYHQWDCQISYPLTLETFIANRQGTTSCRYTSRETVCLP